MNFTRTPNKILDLLPYMDKGELMLTMLLVRHTFGYLEENGRHREEVRFTFDEMAEALGVAKATINRAVGLVEERKIFRRGRRSYWHLNPDYSLNSRLKNTDNSIETEPDYVNGKVQKLDQNSSETRPKQVDNSIETEPLHIYKEKDRKKYIYAHPLPEKYQTLMAEIASVVKTAYGPGVNEDEFEAAAVTVDGWDVGVDAIHGFSSWWEKNGYYKGKPALKSFLDEFRNYLLSLKVPANGNGRKTAVSPSTGEYGGFV